jgi:hypothetical protein
MTRDLLDDLRDADPVDRARLEVPAPLAARALGAGGGRQRSSPWRRAVPAGVLVGAVVAGALVLVLARGEGPGLGLAARAYAATSPKGIVHYRIERNGYANGRLSVQQDREEWVYRDVRHMLAWDRIPPGSTPRLTVDARTVGRRSTTWMASSDDFVRLTRSRGTRTTPSPLPENGNPMLAFRRAYAAGRLTDLGGGRFQVTLPKGFSNASLIYEVDPQTALPRKAIVRMVIPPLKGVRDKPVSSLSVYRFTIYEHLAPTAANKVRLRLLPHPGAGPGTEPASRYFAVLRRGSAPTGADAPDAKQLDLMVKSMARYHLDVRRLRTLRPGIWVVPGRGYVCLFRSDAAGLGGGCVTIKKAAMAGVSTGNLAETVVAVPDGVTALEVRRRGGRWERHAVVRGLVRMDGLRFGWRFVR